MNLLLKLAAVVLFIIAAIIFLANGISDTSTGLGLVAIGLACWCVAGLVGADFWPYRHPRA